MLRPWARGLALGLAALLLPPGPPRHTHAATMTRYTVESLSIVEKATAENLVATLKSKGIDARIIERTVGATTTFVVTAGPWLVREDALAVQQDLNRKQFLFVINGVEVQVASLRLETVTLRDQDHAMGAGPGDQIVWTFNQPVTLGPSVSTTGPLSEVLRAVGHFTDLNVTATEGTLREDGKQVTLTLGGIVKQTAAPAGAFVPVATFVRGEQGQPLEGAGPLPLGGTFDDRQPPHLISVKLEDNDGQAGPGAGDALSLLFDKAVTVLVDGAPPPPTGKWSELVGLLGTFSTPGVMDAPRATLLVKSQEIVVVLDSAPLSRQAPGGTFTPSPNITAARDLSLRVVAEPVAVSGSFDDKDGPVLERIVLADSGAAQGPGTGDTITLVYNEPLAETALKGKKTSGDLKTLLSQFLSLPKNVTLSAAGTKVTLAGNKLVFTLGGKVRGSFPAMPLAPVPGSVPDHSGNPLAATGAAPVTGGFTDREPPVLLSVELRDGGGSPGAGPGDAIVFGFSEPVDVTVKARKGNCDKLQRSVGVFQQGNLTGGECSLKITQTAIHLTLGRNVTMDGGGPPSGTVKVADTVADRTGNRATVKQGLTVSGSFDDRTPPRLVSVILSDNDNADGFGPKDRLSFKFSEPIDTAATQARYADHTTLAAALEKLGNFTSQQGLDAVSVIVRISGPWLSLTHAGGAVAHGPVGGAFTPVAAAVTDRAGNPLSHIAPVQPEGTYNDATPPRLVRVELEDRDGKLTIGAGDTITLVYNEPVRLTADPPPDLPVESLLVPFGTFQDDAILRAASSRLSMEGHRLAIILGAPGRFDSKKSVFTPDDPPRTFTPKPGLVKDASGNVLKSTTPVKVTGNFSDTTPPQLLKVILEDGNGAKGAGPGDRIVLRFSEPVRLVLPQTRLSWPQFNRYIGAFHKAGPLEASVSLTTQANDVIATFESIPVMVSLPTGGFTPVPATFVDRGRNSLPNSASVSIEGAFDDTQGPKLLSVTLLDGNQQPDLGSGDAILLTYNEPLVGTLSQAVARTGTLGELLDLVGTLALPADVLTAKAQALVQQSEITIVLQQDTGRIVATPPTFSPRALSVDDRAGNVLNDTSPVQVTGSFKDGIPPALKRVLLKDQDGLPGPGQGDRLIFDFSEPVEWTFEVPIQGTMESVLAAIGTFSNPGGLLKATVNAKADRDGLTIILVTVPQGASAPQGKFRLKGGVVRDLGGNTAQDGSEGMVQGDFSADVPPMLVGVTYDDKDNNGLITHDDVIQFRYSKDMDGRNLIKTGELTKLLAQLGETRLAVGFNAGQCWLSVKGDVIEVTVGGQVYGESPIFSTFESKSEVLRDMLRNALRPTAPVAVSVPAPKPTVPAFDDSPTRVVALVGSFNSQPQAVQLQDQLLAKRIASLIRSRKERGQTVYLVIAPLPDNDTRKQEILDQMAAMGHPPTLVLVSNRYVSP